MKERIGAVASYWGLPKSGNNGGRGRGCHELICAARKRKKRKNRREVLRVVLGCQMGGVKGLSQICRNLSGVTRFEGRGVAENCRYPSGNDRKKKFGSHELSENNTFKGREWSLYELPWVINK